jgi:hypothetical protein
MHYWLYPFFREAEKRRLWFVDADSTLGPTLASGESEIPNFKLWKNNYFWRTWTFCTLPPNAQTTSTRRRGIAPVIAMSRLGHSSRPLRDPASRHRISDPHFFTFIWSLHCTSNGVFLGKKKRVVSSVFFMWRKFATWRPKKRAGESNKGNLFFKSPYLEEKKLEVARFRRCVAVRRQN